ncbi:hypothetical protein, partial [Tessaracoccus massiliensis]|uniref:hypothetical protein n=1 Tax=Tessaracoccus massiliensis TaxID=1522311 RepID=UPI00058BC7FB
MSTDGFDGDPTEGQQPRPRRALPEPDLPAEAEPPAGEESGTAPGMPGLYRDATAADAEPTHPMPSQPAGVPGGESPE